MKTIKSITKKAKEINARIHTIRIKVKQDRPWKEAFKAGAPETSEYSHVHKVDNLYPPVSNKEEDKEIILLNFPKGDGNWDKVIAFAKENNLQPANPREIFAIGQQHVSLNKTLNEDYIYIVAPVECSFDGLRYACFVWWRGSGRKASLGWVRDFDGALDWFGLCVSTSSSETKLSFDPLYLELSAAVKVVKENGYKIFKEI